MKKKSFRIRLILSFLCVPCACVAQANLPSVAATPENSVTGESSPAPSSPAPTLVAEPVDPNYLLQADDLLQVVIFREPDLTTESRVRKDGLFDMKLLGGVKLAALTVDQATEVIRAALARDYLVNPRVNIAIVSYAKRKVNILGEVRNPGLYTFPEHGSLSLNDAVAMAGGFLPSADRGHVAVKRLSEGETTSLVVDAAAARADAFNVQPDDAINVAVLPRRHFTVLGQINRPGTYDVEDGRPVYLTDAIALAGGYTRIANQSKVLLKRMEAGREIVMDLDAKAMGNSAETQRLEIRNEDTITVTENFF